VKEEEEDEEGEVGLRFEQCDGRKPTASRCWERGPAFFFDGTGDDWTSA
jgi:hypothetical protein